MQLTGAIPKKCQVVIKTSPNNFDYLVSAGKENDLEITHRVEASCVKDHVNLGLLLKFFWKLDMEHYRLEFSLHHRNFKGDSTFRITTL